MLLVVAYIYKKYILRGKEKKKKKKKKSVHMPRFELGISCV